MTPYDGQGGAKTSHDDLLRNPEIIDFMAECEDVPRPTQEEIRDTLDTQPKIDDFTGDLPKIIIAIDGSTYESSLDPKFPSRRIGYVKISMVILQTDEYGKLKERSTRAVDPMAVAKLQENTEAISMGLPGAYVLVKGADSVSDGFRRKLMSYYRSPNTKLGDKTLYDTLFEVAGRMSPSRVHDDHLIFKVCPNRECPSNHKSDEGEDAKKPSYKVDIRVPHAIGQATCPHCESTVYATDILRVHEDFLESGSNVSSLGRLMLITEHLLAAHYLLHLRKHNKNLLGQTCIIVDGPLAVFGNPAPLHTGIMRLFNEINEGQREDGHDIPVIMGLSKTGAIADHANLIKNLLPDGTIFPISDAYRYDFIDVSKRGRTANFGQETYYGQDFLVKTNHGRLFPMCLAYPLPDKKDEKSFQHQKMDMAKYTTMGRALKVLTTFESDLYQNSMIPVILAHRHASISHTPGGKVLDIFSRMSVGKS